MTTEPQMHCSGCENRIKQNIRFGKGFGKIGFRISRYTCTPQKK